MVRVSGCCDEDSEDEDQNSSDWNARNRGDDSQEIIPNIEEEGRRGDMMMKLKELTVRNM